MIMKLKTWLAVTRTPQKLLAEQLGISRSYLSLIVSGDRLPAEALAEQISVSTDGKVTKKDLIVSDSLPTDSFSTNGNGSPLTEELRRSVLGL
jgi:DNA-binding transcriptional regulator YdaS (Cro superfamily)